MSKASQRRHHRRALDQVLHLVFRCFEESQAREAFCALTAVVRAKSKLFDTEPRVVDGLLRFDVVEALVNLARFWREHRADAASWPGDDPRQCAHPRATIDSLQCHLFELHSMPRFLAQVWESADHGGAPNPDYRQIRDEADGWRYRVLAHGRGASWRSLSLPIPLTRAMQCEFLASAEHLTIPYALRRAEVLGLGGSPRLADAIAGSRLGSSFRHTNYWRTALQWMVRQGDDLKLDCVEDLLDYFEAARGWTDTPPVSGRTVASCWRQVVAWNKAMRSGGAGVTWPAAPWLGLDERASLSEGRTMYWHLFQLRDAAALNAEGHAMRHCVGAPYYRRVCTRGVATIWSLRRRIEQPGAQSKARSVFTLEIDPKTRTLEQLTGFANGKPSGPGVEIVRKWLEEQGIQIAASLHKELAW